MRTGRYITPHELINPKLNIRLMNNELIQVARFETHVAALLQAALLRYQFKLNLNMGRVRTPITTSQARRPPSGIAVLSAEVAPSGLEVMVNVRIWMSALERGTRYSDYQVLECGRTTVIA